MELLATVGCGEDAADLAVTPNRYHQNTTPNDITDKMIAIIDNVSAVPQLSLEEDDDDDESLGVCVKAELLPVDDDAAEDAAVDDDVVVAAVVGAAMIVTDGDVSAPGMIARL